ncbi:MAG: class II aldolase/adducin family protein [Phycisphaerae bacterium]|nr:class II aldolase/adducin family protein [Phycisphaerae bacterium]
MDMLDAITGLSHEFGTVDYVRGGGGNTSCKDQATLWVKPSGTTLGGMTAESFVAMDRGKIAELYEMTPPEDSAAREVMVKDIMAAAVQPGATGRPSVEAPLHNSFQATYVVHTHPALVNGMTCAAGGAEACAEMFPDALWIDYIDPGYTLCMRVREEIQAYTARHGRQPSVVFLKNHGVFIAADTPEEIRCLHTEIMDSLRQRYSQAGIAMELEIGVAPSAQAVETTEKQLRETIGTEDAAGVCASGAFTVAAGAISPDHIVYHKSHALTAEPTAEAIAEFIKAYGYSPRIVSCDAGVFGVGNSQKNAGLALELAQDGALIIQLADAFGGIAYLDKAAGDFIENWEVESYRRKQV